MTAPFRFGENWTSFLTTISDESVARAMAGLTQLIPSGDIAGHSFLDIGCGSGLPALAALRLGASRVVGIDADPQSATAATALLKARAAGANWSIEHKSIFALPADPRWDVVYSWGVLHHTGNMWAAVERAAAQVAPGGILAIALYRRTPLCAAWVVEKRLYSRAPAAGQACMRALFKSLYLAGVMAGGRNPWRYIKDYHARGMDWHHDVHDWLGGYPYESTTPDEVVSFLTERGFKLERSFTHPAPAAGLFGSHCDEFVARKIG